jgi:hypothetical protein
MPYLGLKVHGCYMVDGRMRYESWSLGHVPLGDKTAKALAGVATDILVQYEIDGRVKYVVSDTTSVMPATVRAMPNKI